MYFHVTAWLKRRFSSDRILNPCKSTIEWTSYLPTPLPNRSFDILLVTAHVGFCGQSKQKNSSQCVFNIIHVIIYTHLSKDQIVPHKRMLFNKTSPRLLITTIELAPFTLPRISYCEAPCSFSSDALHSRALSKQAFVSMMF